MALLSYIKPEYIPYIDQLIELAIAEDIGNGDHSSLCCIDRNQVGRMRLLIKESGVLAGVEVAERVFRRVAAGASGEGAESDIKMEILLRDGARVKLGDIAFYVTGRLLTLLQAERIVLNIMQRMSGVATQTAIYADELTGLKAKVLDTRKTTPGMRVLDKMAVKIGGGENHRIGLFDMIILKDNHIDFAGGITAAVQNARKYLADRLMNSAATLTSTPMSTSLPLTLSLVKIEVEVRTFDDILEVFAVGGVDRIMLDNFSVDDTQRAVELIRQKATEATTWAEKSDLSDAGHRMMADVEIESSGGIRLDNLRAYGECGVDFVSVGALTHQIKSLDLSLKAD